MSKGETKMWEYLGPKLRPFGHFERIESHETAVGTPDVSYCIGGYCNHMELKYSEKEKGGLRIRPSQLGWFRKRTHAGGQPWVLAGCKIRETRGYVLIPGCNVPALKNTTDVKDWLMAGIAIWESKIIIEELAEFLGTFLVAKKESNGHPEEESSGLILPSHIRKN